jgi:hypothetical protein
MALNFGILQPVNIGGQILAGQQEAQRNQLAQQQLRTGEMQQQKAEMELTDFKAKQEGLDKFLQMSAANGKTGSPEDLASSFYDFAVSQRDPQLIMTAQTLAQAAKERSAYNASRQPPKISPVAPAPGALGSGTFDVNAPMPAANRLAPAPVAPAAPVNQLGADTTALENRIIDLQTNYPNVPQAQKEAERLIKQLDETRKLYAVGGSLVTGAGKPIFTAPKEAAAPPAMVAEYTFAKTPEGGGFKGSYQQFVTARAAAGRAPAQPTAPIAVIDPITKQPIYVSREEALRNKMQPAANAPALKPLTEGQEIKLRTDVGKDYKAATTALSQMDDLLDSIEAVKTAPGLAAATGFTGKYLPSFSEGAAAQAETRIANLRGKVTALGKATAAMSGSIGSIANQEWKILSDQIAALDEVKGKGPLLEQIGLVEAQALRSMNLIRDTYEKTRAEDFERFPQFRDLPQPRRAAEPAASGTGGFKYLGKEGG